MRWFKCDLHVHTPEDSRHWRDDALSLGNPRRVKESGGRTYDETGIQEKARRYLDRCHDLGLSVIGVTDHNFSDKTEPRDWFLTHLVEQNQRVANRRGVDPLFIFPGFEVDIGYHVLCLFPLASRAADIKPLSDVITKLGLEAGSRFDNGSPNILRCNGATRSLKDLLDIVQRESGGLVIAAHADSKNTGLLFASSNRNDYAHQTLYCVEVTQYPLEERCADILAGRNRDWRRDRFHPAYIQSSDAKSLEVDPNGQPKPNSLGYRHTWIKMSTPQIEALRQAFLDPESRIRCGAAGNPAESETHARLLSMSVSGAAFLKDQSVTFSPNLTCIVGGRGSGKSAILEGMRLAMGKDKAADDRKLDDRTREKVERIRALLGHETRTEVRVRWRSADGVEDIFIYTPGQCRVDGRTLPDPGSFFRTLPVQFFSQQQLNKITDAPDNRLLALVDDFAGEPLRTWQHKARGRCEEIRRLLTAIEALTQTDRDIKRLEQENEDLDRQWTARVTLQDEARRRQALKAADAYIRKVNAAVDADGERLVTVAEDIFESHAPLGSATDRWPDGDWFRSLDEQVLREKESLKQEITAAVTAYGERMRRLFADAPRWPSIRDNLAAADRTFADACQAQGVAAEDVSRIQDIDRRRALAMHDLDAKRREQERLRTEQQKLPGLFNELHDAWIKAFDIRASIAKEINSAATDTDRPVIELVAAYGADPAGFLAVWGNLVGDRRTRLGRAWDDLGQAIHRQFIDNHKPSDTPSAWQMIQNWLDEKKPIPECIHAVADWDDVRSHLSGPASQAWREARLTRVDDSIDLILYRRDAQPKARPTDAIEVGRVSNGTLSDGQRNAAVLAMLLAQGQHPLIMDQPEDELDSQFIFRDLVPLLRRMKHKRQIILVTHNANLPVNGDAELVYALEASEGRGTLRAEGGLDRKEVAEAVLEIMEGSETAFRRRLEKYHF